MVKTVSSRFHRSPRLVVQFLRHLITSLGCLGYGLSVPGSSMDRPTSKPNHLLHLYRHRRVLQANCRSITIASASYYSIIVICTPSSIISLRIANISCFHVHVISSTNDLQCFSSSSPSWLPSASYVCSSRLNEWAISHILQSRCWSGPPRLRTCWHEQLEASPAELADGFCAKARGWSGWRIHAFGGCRSLDFSEARPPHRDGR